jgi:nicotinate-nucleotide adenylyltransferase
MSSSSRSTERVKIGLLGGTFDPPHRGHLGMGTLARDRLGLERILYMPAPVPPHKAGTVARFEDRFEMTQRLIEGEARLEASDFEERLPAPHYTVRTLTELLAGPLAGAELHLIVGADSLTELHLWREHKRLFELARLVAVSRVGYALTNPLLPAGLLDSVIRLDELEEPVSSTELRRRLAKREPAPEIPARVMEYIEEKGLYR